VFVTTATGGRAASYNADNGTLRWRQDTEFAEPSPGQPPAMLTEPVWHDDTVQIGVNWRGAFAPDVLVDSGGVAVLSPASGAALQPTPPPEVFGSPAAVDVWVGADGAPRAQLSTRITFGLDCTAGDVWYAWAGAKAGFFAHFLLPMAQAVEVDGNLIWGDADVANGWVRRVCRSPTATGSARRPGPRFSGAGRPAPPPSEPTPPSTGTTPAG
jgi:hypothetical protein